jgi:hypothetical protein
MIARFSRRILVALAVGATWFAGWFFVGGLVELTEPEPSFIDVWPMTLGLPAFFAGIVFAIVFGIAERGGVLHRLSLARMAGLGAGSGLLAGTLALGVLALIATPTDPSAVRTESFVILAAMTAMSLLSAPASLLLARTLRPWGGLLRAQMSILLPR